MVSSAETEWRSFRRYEYKGIDIAEAPGRIRFSQTNMTSYSKSGSRTLAVVCALLVFGPSFVIAAQGGEAIIGAMIYFFLSAIVAGIILLIGSFAVRVPIVLEITPGDVSLTSGAGKQHFPDIRTIEVRREEQWANIYLWDGPAPVYLFSFSGEQVATAVQQGIIAAIKFVNGVEDKAPVPAQTVPAQQRNYFPE